MATNYTQVFVSKFVYALSSDLPFMVTYNCYITSTQQLVTLISYKCTYNCYITSTQQLVTLISYNVHTTVTLLVHNS